MSDPIATPDLQARYDILLRELQRERAEAAKLKAAIAPLRLALGLHPQAAPAAMTPRSMEA